MLGKRPSRAPSASALAAATISPLLAMAGFCFQVARIASSMVKGAAMAREDSERTAAVSAQPWKPRRVRFSMTCRIRTLLGAGFDRKDSSEPEILSPRTESSSFFEDRESFAFVSALTHCKQVHASTARRYWWLPTTSALWMSSIPCITWKTVTSPPACCGPSRRRGRVEFSGRIGRRSQGLAPGN
jgi:hypothetical protein